MGRMEAFIIYMCVCARALVLYDCISTWIMYNKRHNTYGDIFITIKCSNHETYIYLWYHGISEGWGHEGHGDSVRSCDYDSMAVRGDEDGSNLTLKCTQRDNAGVGWNHHNGAPFSFIHKQGPPPRIPSISTNEYPSFDLRVRTKSETTIMNMAYLWIMSWVPLMFWF